MAALVTQVMRDRGYPVDDDFQQRAADVSVEHPVVVDNYRAAHAISGRARRGQTSTESCARRWFTSAPCLTICSLPRTLPMRLIALGPISQVQRLVVLW